MADLVNTHVVIKSGYAFNPALLPPELKPFVSIHAMIDGVVCVKTPNGYAPVPEAAMLKTPSLYDEVLLKAMSHG